MNLTIKPGFLKGTITAVSSKSYAHRQIIAAMLSDKETVIKINAFSDDILQTIACTEALGAKCLKYENKVVIKPITKRKEYAQIDCGESGTTARIMLPVSCTTAKKTTLSGRGRLPLRPFKEMTELMRAHGCNVSSDTLPMTVSGEISAGKFPIPGNVSSQYITGLMMALPKLSTDSSIVLTSPLKSSAYVDITIDVLKSFGIDVKKTNKGYFVPAQKYVSPKMVVAEGDWSNAAFWIVAEALGAQIKVENLNYNSVQGDKKIIDLLDKTEIDVDEIPDLFPVLAVLAAGRKGKTVLYNASRLRLKESDRIDSVSKMLNNLGCETIQDEDSLTVFGTGKLKGGVVDGCNDHRIVMSAAVAALISESDVTIIGADAVNKSYPSFFEEYIKLGGDVNVF